MTLDALLPLGAYPPMLSLNPKELEALGRLGVDRFEHWLRRGYFATQQPGGAN